VETADLPPFHLPDAVFQKRENSASDLRIDDYNTQGVVHYFNRVWITTSPPSGQPPQMPLLADVTLEAGDSADIAVGAMDSESNPLAVSLGAAPAFATLDGNAAVQMLHLAPTIADAVCADVVGPGVTSSAEYIVSVVADDPHSVPSSGASAFRVNIAAGR